MLDNLFTEAKSLVNQDFTIRTADGKTFTVHAKSISKHIPSCTYICKAILGSACMPELDGIARYLNKNKKDYPLIQLNYIAELMEERREELRRQA